MTSHTLAGEHAARVLTITGRTGRVRRNRVTVRSATGLEVVTLDDAGEALTNRVSGHIDLFTDREDFDAQSLASLEFGDLISINVKFFKRRTGFNAGFGELARKSLRHAAGTAGTKRDLDRVVTIGSFRLNSCDSVVRHIEHRHGNGNTFLRENARHADLATNKAKLITHYFLHPGYDWPGPLLKNTTNRALAAKKRCDFNPIQNFLQPGWFKADYSTLILTSTPAGRSSFIRASTVLSVGSMMSIRRWCVRISN